MQPADLSYNVPPFPAFPSVSRYVPLGSVQEAMGRVCRSIDAKEAISLVIGPPGTGKSLLCGLLVEHYRATHEVVIIGETPIDNRAAFLRHLLHHLGADYASTPERDLQLALVDRVCDREAPTGGLLIVVDEAQSLSADVLEAIRMVTNITRAGEPRVLAVLCGGLKLDETLVDTSLEALTQRVATRCYLHPMNSEEARRYVRETIRACGADPNTTITNEAIAAVQHACSGVPRLINQMMTHAIDCAEEADQSLITEKIIDRAWAQLQQLPSPMIEEPKISHNTVPIEFGELDELDPVSNTTGSSKSAPPPLADTYPSDDSVADDCEDFLTDHSIAAEAIEGGSLADDSQHDLQAWEQTDCDDIHVEPSTAMWVDDSEAGIKIEQPDKSSRAASVVPSKLALFGEFDIEEEIALGNGLTPAKIVGKEPPADLESMLHHELVGIATFNDSIFTTAESVPLVEPESDSQEFLEQPEEQVEDFIEPSDEDAQLCIEDECERDDVEQVVLTICDSDDQEITSDDSDLLVIEDEIELTRCDPAVNSDGKQKTIAVDFQAMLLRMRTGS